MEKKEIDKDMEILLKKILDNKELEVLKIIIENRGDITLKERN
jgi:hypothetical protein